jgi:hypothetical protein
MSQTHLQVLVGNLDKKRPIRQSLPVMMPMMVSQLCGLQTVFIFFRQLQMWLLSFLVKQLQILLASFLTVWSPSTCTQLRYLSVLLVTF